MSGYICRDCGCNVRPGAVFAMPARIIPALNLPPAVGRRARRVFILCERCAPDFPDARQIKPAFPRAILSAPP